MPRLFDDKGEYTRGYTRKLKDTETGSTLVFILRLGLGFAEGAVTILAGRQGSFDMAFRLFGLSGLGGLLQTGNRSPKLFGFKGEPLPVSPDLSPRA